MKFIYNAQKIDSWKKNVYKIYNKKCIIHGKQNLINRNELIFLILGSYKILCFQLQ